MKFIKEPENGIWIAVRDNLTSEIIRQRILDRQVWFADLDDCDADSPAKKIAKNQIGTGVFDRKYIHWFFTYGLPAKFDKNKESLAWKEYVESFLRDEKALSQIKEMFNPEETIKSLYPGVGQFYSILLADKYYLTRNIKEVVQAYAEVLGFRDIFPELYDKKDLVERFILEHPTISRYGLSGDSLEDELAIDTLKFYHKKEIIAQPISLYRADSPKESNPNFDINVGKDRTSLVDILIDQI